MAFLCHRRGCTAEDHRREYVYGVENYGIGKIRKALVNLTPDQMLLLQKIRLNWLNTKNPIYMFLSGSVVVECLWDESICKHLDAMADVEAVEKVGDVYYLPHTLLSGEVVENLPLPEISDEEYEVRKFYVISMRGTSGEASLLEAISAFLERASVFLERKIAKVVRGVPYIPQLANKYVDKIDILLKMSDGVLMGFGYVDVSRTYHLGFSAVKNLLLYGLDRVMLLHPYVNQDFHRGVSNKIRGRWDISEVGYAAVNLADEEMYMYKMPKVNRYLQMSVSTQRHHSLIRSYIESL